MRASHAQAVAHARGSSSTGSGAVPAAVATSRAALAPLSVSSNPASTAGGTAGVPLSAAVCAPDVGYTIKADVTRAPSYVGPAVTGVKRGR
ncbi:hypothetical protein EON66_09730 [archaeon]|nr:MAG: hypothetical protein EON66_09730 [archaeon]